MESIEYNRVKSSSTVMFLIYCTVLFFMILESETKSQFDYQTKQQLAQAHYERVLFKISCGEPQARVFRMETPELKLVPSATVLHRCGEHTGCCDTAAQKCVAKSKENIKLFFFVKSFDGRPWKRGRRHKIKKFIVANHTECHCVDMSHKPR